MSAQLMLAFLLFSISIGITPGAGNIALLGISSRYGFAATLPFVSGNAFWHHHHTGGFKCWIGELVYPLPRDLHGNEIPWGGLFTVYGVVDCQHGD